MKQPGHHKRVGFPWGLIWIFLFVIVALTAIASVIYLKQRERIVEKQREKLTAVSQLQVNRIQNWRENHVKATRLLKESPYLRQFLAITDREREKQKDKVRRWLQDVAEIHQLKQICILDPITRETIFSTADHPTSDPIDPGILDNLVKTDQVPGMVWHQSGDLDVHLDFVSPVMEDQHSVAILILTVNPFIDLFPLIQQWPSPSETAESLLVSKEGDHVLFLNELRHQKDTALKLTIPLTRKSLPAVMAVSGIIGPVEGLDYRNEPVLAYVTPVGDSGWYLVSKIDRREILEPVNQWFISVAVLTGLLILIAGLLILLYWRHQRAICQQESLSAQLAFKEQERRWATLLNNLPGMVYRCLNDHEWTMIMVSQGCFGLTGYRPNELIANRTSSYNEVILPADREHVWETVEKAVKKKGPFQIEYRIRHKDGSVRWVWEQGSPVLNKDGTIEALEGFISDITPVRHASDLQDLAQEIYRAADRTTSLTGFFTELRTILSTHMNTEHFVVACYQPETETFRAIVSESREEFVTEYPAAHRLSDYIRRIGEARLINADQLNELIDKGEVKQFGTPAEQWMGIPLSAGNSVFGVMILQSYEHRNMYAKHDLELLSILSGQLSAIISRRIAEDALRVSESKYRELANRLTVGLYRTTPDGELLFYNEVLTRILGAEHPDELKGRNVNEFYLDQGDRVRHLDLLSESPQDAVDEFKLKRLDGTIIWVRNRNHTISNDSGEPIFFEGILEDITEQKQLEERLAQTQRMESIGQLAGGVAHDFNNLLTPILGYSELLLSQAPPGWEGHDYLEAVQKAGESAKKLVQQLLAYGRRQILRIETVELNHMLQDLEPLLRRTIPESVRIRVDLFDEPLTVRADISQLEQVILNLAINARDAMPEGGVLHMSLSRERFREKEEDSEIDPGTYALLSISDSGKGMDVETLSKVFEPFFSTKERARGTGLGLAMVHGIVKQHDGHIRAASNPGAGTRFDIYLPEAAESVTVEPDPEPDQVIRGNGERILLVEDSPEVRRLTSSMLTEMNYEVLVADTPSAALKLANEQSVDMLLSDVIMPDMNGPELYLEMRKVHPHLPVVFMSGYSEDVLGAEMPNSSWVYYVQKPFKTSRLSIALHEALNNSKSSG